MGTEDLTRTTGLLVSCLASSDQGMSSFSSCQLLRRIWTNKKASCVTLLHIRMLTLLQSPMSAYSPLRSLCALTRLAVAQKPSSPVLHALSVKTTHSDEKMYSVSCGSPDSLCWSQQCGRLSEARDCTLYLFCIPCGFYDFAANMKVLNTYLK